MAHDSTIWVAAAEFVKRHGMEAPKLAQEWSHALAERQEDAAAAICLQIGEAAGELLAKVSSG